MRKTKCLFQRGTNPEGIVSVSQLCHLQMKMKDECVLSAGMK